MAVGKIFCRSGMDYEIHVGHKYLHAVSLFLSPLTILEFHAHAAEEYGKIRAELERGGTPIGPMDMLIAGHARSEGLILVTNNTREFRRVEGLMVEDWAQDKIAHVERDVGLADYIAAMGLFVMAFSLVTGLITNLVWSGNLQ